MQKKVFPLIKIISIALISSAIGLALWNIYTTLNHGALPNSLNLVFLFGCFAMAIHAIEAVAVAAYAPSKKKPPIQYGIYTFFVGTVGVLELFDQDIDQTMH